MSVGALGRVLQLLDDLLAARDRPRRTARTPRPRRRRACSSAGRGRAPSRRRPCSRVPRYLLIVFAFAGDSTTTSAFAITLFYVNRPAGRQFTNGRPANVPAELDDTRPAVPAPQPRQQLRAPPSPSAPSAHPGDTPRPSSSANKAVSISLFDGSRNRWHAPNLRGHPSSSRISSADSTTFAPSFRSPCDPRFLPRRTLPGTAMTSRPCSSA